VIRLDHFRGFSAYWEIPAHESTAIHGRWMPGPGRALFDAIRKDLGDIQLIAEDLGHITAEVNELRRSVGLPGMKILQFGFAPDDLDSIHHPDRHVENRVVYTGTHDNDTAAGWYGSLDDATRGRVDEAIDRYGVREPEPHWSLIRLAFASPARLAMIQQWRATHAANGRLARIIRHVLPRFGARQRQLLQFGQHGAENAVAYPERAGRNRVLAGRKLLNVQVLPGRIRTQQDRGAQPQRAPQ
jgi:4-alpha-glucanotransferase